MIAFGVDVRRAAHPEFAEFLRLALDAKLAKVDEVVRWADTIILSQPDPPAWSIDLALCRNWPLHRISDALAALGMRADGDVVRFLLAGRLAGAVKRGEVAPLRAMELAWNLPLRRLDREPLDAVTQTVYEFDHWLESLEKGWGSREKAESILCARLAEFAALEWRP